MPFCHQCGVEIGADPEERYCWSCGADQNGAIAIAVPVPATFSAHLNPGSVPPAIAGRQRQNRIDSEKVFDLHPSRTGVTAWMQRRTDAVPVIISRATEFWHRCWRRLRVQFNTLSDSGGDRTTLLRVATYAAGVALLGVAARLGDFSGVMLALPMVAGGVVVVAQPEPVIKWAERFDAWVGAKHSAVQTRQGKFFRWLVRPYLGGLERIATWTGGIGNKFTRFGVRIAGYLYFSWLFLVAVYLAAMVAFAIIVVAIAIVVSLWILSEYLSYQSGSTGYARPRPLSRPFREGEKFTVRQREPGVLDSIFGGSKASREIVDENSNIVGTIQKEEPGLLGSLTGAMAKDVVRTPDGEKVATFDREAPGLFGSLLGEEPKTVLRGAAGEKLGEFDREEPGFVGSLLGDKPKTVIRGPDGKELAELGYEEPGLLGSLVGEKPKRVIKVKSDTSDGIDR